ncbi:MAG: hypothetical protein HY791_06520 [Deltaproteobacteria bacterium]|nr:hypothetical protein [Deltaproteobacteria bacterium]
MPVLEVKDQLEDLRRRAAELTEELAYHEHREHVLESPLVSRKKYLELRRELEALESRGVSRSLGSASHRKPAEARPAFERSNHRPKWPDPVSLRSHAELKKHIDAFSSESRPVFVGSAALAGAYVALTYHGGELDRAVLRGDGEEGEDVTDNIRTLMSIPLRLRPAGSVTESRVTRVIRGNSGPSTLTPVPPIPEELVVRGVLSMKHLDLHALDRRRIDAGEPPYVRPVAAILGSVRRLDPRITASRPVRFFANDVLSAPVGIESHWQLLGALKSWGFAVTSLAWRCVGVDEILDFVSALQEQQPSYPYPLEGGELVSNRGLNPQAPRRVMLAFTPSSKRARVSSIYRAVGRSGTIFPVALLSKINEKDAIPDGVPVPALDGTRLLDVQPEDTVAVVAGPVAPLLTLERGSTTSRPDEGRERCPSCRQYLRRPTDEPFLYCENGSCKGRTRARILHAMGPRGLGLKSVSSKNVDALVGAGISSLADLFALRPDGLPHYGPLLAGELASLRRLPLWRVLYLLTIPHVGERAARLIAAHAKSLEGVLSLGPSSEIPGLPPECAQGLKAWLSSGGREMLTRLSSLGVVMLPDSVCFSAPFAERRIVLAGETELPADRLIDQLERRGALIEPRVSRRTSLVVTGREADEVVQSAISFDVPCVDEHAITGLMKMEEERAS